MTVGNDSAFDRPYRVDMKAAGLAAQAGGHGHQDILRAHAMNIGRIAGIFTRLART
jgi:hypothetical protein